MRKSPTSSRRPAPSLRVSGGGGGAAAAAAGSYYAPSSSHRHHASVTMRPPVLLAFSAHSTLSAGHVGSVRPKHTIELPSVGDFQEPAATSTTDTNLAQVYFQVYAAPMEQIYRLLVGASSGTASTSASAGNSGGGGGSNGRVGMRVIVLHSQGLYPNRDWKLGIARILQDVLSISHVSFQSTIQMIPFAMTIPPIASSTNDATDSTTTTAPTVFLCVLLTAREAQCVVYASGHLLEYTFQSCGYAESLFATTTTTATHGALFGNVGELRAAQEDWLSPHNAALVETIAHCVAQCPMPLRKHAIHNLLVTGTVVVDNFATRLALRLYDYLSNPPTTNRSAMSPKRDNDPSIPDDTMAAEDPHTVVEYTRVPIQRSLLRPLAEHIAVITVGGSEDNHERFAELLPWLGASIWAHYWYQYEQECGQTAAPLQWRDLREETLS
jgi:hypothetical protein